eukprot:Phypoly_transcript_11820.p1 GENE.Phypoly_transcript_11820~~Phypoly_transcript_11820.p1  ORF type:complete len:322 (+),score=87.31 Phypoly_transcript_11820:118-1083(+)
MFSYLTSLFYTDVDAAIQHLNSNQVAESDNAILQLSKHDDEKTNRELVEKGAIPRLVDLLCQIETHEKTKERIAGILANVALCGKESKREIAERGGIPPLVELLFSGSPEARKNAVCALMNVLVEDENISFCDEKLVESLVGLLGSDDPQLKKHAAGTLANIATDKEKREQMVAKKVVPGLVDLLKSGDIHAKGNAAGALMNIVEGDDVLKLHIARLGAVEPLAQLLQNGTTAGKVRATSLLYDLWVLNEHKVREEINQPKIVELLEDLVTNGTNVESQCAEPLLYLLREPLSNSGHSLTSESSFSTIALDDPASDPTTTQ